MILYHGTNTDFKEIDLKKSRPNKDFGRGFYLTHIRKQAVQMAVRRCEFAGWGSPVVQRYEFDETLLHDDSMNVKIFNGVSEEWALFIIKTETLMARKNTTMILSLAPLPTMV